VIGIDRLAGALSLRHKENARMKTVNIAGIVLLVLGIISLAYQGISYTTQKKAADRSPEPPRLCRTDSAEVQIPEEVSS
jgi:hypothetical protein